MSENGYIEEEYVLELIGVLVLLLSAAKSSLVFKAILTTDLRRLREDVLSVQLSEMVFSSICTTRGTLKRIA